MVEGDDFDLVHTGRLYIAEAALGTGVARRTLDLDEDDAWAWRRQAELAREAGRVETAEWAEAEAQAEDRLLGRIASRFDALFVAGDLDRQRLLARHGGLRLEVIPNSVSLPASPRRNEERDTLLFVGNLSYAPNIEGIVWFIREVLPLILKVRAVRLRIVGRGHSVALAGLADGAVEVLGAVENLTAIYEASTLAIAPLFSGAGTRIKVIEAAAFGVPLVATTIATQGLAISAETIWQADDAAGFGAAILAALSDPEERARRARGARLLVAERYDRERIVGDLANRFGDILERT
ncbi:MAG: glycosyltransferase [Mesorhizobium sp.]|nr:glycosyltransferase [Mesorhizobium sp.]MBL8579970.1 glycosyltransferase [Mesorhizobium sp.]